jgi:hypothetical protein
MYPLCRTGDPYFCLVQPPSRPSPLPQGAFKGVTAVPASDVAASEAAICGIPQQNYFDLKEIDVFLAEVDELDRTDFSVVMGRQAEPHQPQLMRARLVQVTDRLPHFITFLFRKFTRSQVYSEP